MKQAANSLKLAAGLSAIALAVTVAIKTDQKVLAEQSAPKQLKVGFVMVGPVNDYGYNMAHDRGRQFVQANCKGVQTSFVEKVPENAEAERVMEKMIARGNKLIFSTSYGYLEPAERVAKRHPDVIIMQTWRQGKAKNMGCYAANLFEPLYATGIVAGKMTKKNTIGFVCAHPVPVVLNDINSFALGARSVNPKVKIKVVWTNSWSDPPTEAEAAKGLIDSGCDVLSCVLDSTLTVAKTAEKHNILLAGTEGDLHDIVPKAWLTGGAWNWDKFYADVTRQVQEGKWQQKTFWLGMKEDATVLCPFGKMVPEALKKQALAAAQAVKQGQPIFKGPLKDSSGKLRLQDGQVADSKWLSEMDFFVAGVEGTLPKH